MVPCPAHTTARPVDASGRVPVARALVLLDNPVAVTFHAKGERAGADDAAEPHGARGGERAHERESRVRRASRSEQTIEAVSVTQRAMGSPEKKSIRSIE